MYLFFSENKNFVNNVYTNIIFYKKSEKGNNTQKTTNNFIYCTIKKYSMKSKLFLVILLVSLLALSACTKTVEEVTADDSLVGELVKVKGTVRDTVKIGDLAGYTLVDKNDDTIIVRTSALPTEGDTIVASGTLKKGLFGVGYYIDATDK